MKKIITLIFLTLTGNTQAGLFLDLDMGLIGFGWESKCPCARRYLSDENPMGQVRIGYETSQRQLFKWVKVSGHAYYQHTSSMSNGDDTGVDFFLGGIRLEL